MKAGHMNILIAAEDSHSIASIAHELVVSTQADISIVDTIEEARILSESKAFDVIIAAATLDDGSGMSLIAPDEQGASTPVIILDDASDGDRVLSAIHAGAADVFVQPIELDRLIESVRRIAHRHRRQSTVATRAKRLRSMTSRLVRDRRELRQRVDLICRDLVQAYRRLAEKVVANPQEEPADAP